MTQLTIVKFNFLRLKCLGLVTGVERSLLEYTSVSAAFMARIAHVEILYVENLASFTVVTDSEARTRTTISLNME